MSKISIKEVRDGLESCSSFIIEDGVVYVNPIQGFSKEVVGSYEIDEDGDISIELNLKSI